MKNDDYSQHSLSDNDLPNQICWLTEGLDDIDALFLDGVLIGITLPHTIELEIVETTPAIKGASATARTKPARVISGGEIMVPEYLSNGEIIKINTETGKCVSRA